MGLPDSGTYEIINHATGSYIDLRAGSIVPNNNLIGFPGHGGPNQKWVLEREGNIITLHSHLSPEAAVVDKGHVAGSGVVVRPQRERYEIIEQQTGLYRIKVIGENLFFRLESGAPLTPVTINYNGKGNDLWKFNLIPVT
ncbi:hypothetical protein F5887DRAFT_428267 [Amanita rubescens]|nr:hypothetical protein F5887DRAFT_428267 [Amanita rubescens]